MKKLILTLAIAALTIAFAAQAQASGKPGSQAAHKSTATAKTTASHVNATNVNTNKLKTTNVNMNKLKTTNVNVNRISNYHLKYGTKTSFGYSYRGRRHNHWTVTRYDARYGCNCYWDPYVSTWYYWCDRDASYYPVSYCPYRCYSCTEQVAVRPGCTTCTNATMPEGIPAETEAPPADDTTPIPEPVEPQQ